MKPGKSAIELQIVAEIKRRLRVCRRSKLWLAEQLGMDYGKVKRVLNENDSQQLSLTVANNMLALLGTNLVDAMTYGVIKTITDELDKLKFSSAAI